MHEDQLALDHFFVLPGSLVSNRRAPGDKIKTMDVRKIVPMEVSFVVRHGLS